VSSLQHVQIVDLFKVRNASVNVVAVRSSTDHKVISTHDTPSYCDAGSATTAAGVRVDRVDRSDSDAAISDGAGDEMDDVRDRLMLVRQMVRDSDVKRTKSRDHVSSSSSSAALPAVQTPRDRPATRKTASSVHSAAAGDVDKQTVKNMRSSGKLETSADHSPVEV